jgi:hypothetical protein
MGSLEGLLPEPVSAEVEQRVQELLLRKMAAAVALYVGAVRALAATGGPEAVEALRQEQLRRSVEGAAERGRQGDNSVRAYCRVLEHGCRGSHEWEKTEDSDTRQGYRFTRCMWAETFRALGAADVGRWICEGDGPAAAAFSPAIRLEVTKTLMAGDDCCEAVFYTGDPL